MMSRWSRALLAGAAVALLASLLLPLWRISLEAPQYPEGLGMNIWADKITGDLRSINGLNHYIGMKEIHPEAIPELRLMPIVVVSLGVLGLAGAILGRRWGLYGWTGLLLVAALVGLADFWKWGYDYGHDLDPTAAIKVPGLSYQPPLIGAKQMLNFRAVSLPASGGWLASGGILLAVALVVIEYRRGRRLG
jgi:copper chaperone NosL